MSSIEDTRLPSLRNKLIEREQMEALEEAKSKEVEKKRKIKK